MMSGQSSLVNVSQTAPCCYRVRHIGPQRTKGQRRGVHKSIKDALPARKLQGPFPRNALSVPDRNARGALREPQPLRERCLGVTEFSSRPITEQTAGGDHDSALPGAKQNVRLYAERVRGLPGDPVQIDAPPPGMHDHLPDAIEEQEPLRPWPES